MFRQAAKILRLAHLLLPILEMAVAQVATTRLALHVPQLHQQDMPFPIPAAVAAQVAIIPRGMLA